MALYARLADLPLAVDRVERTRHERETASGFTRVTTEVALHGDGATGRGEDVTYEAAAHDGFAGVDLPLAGDYTLESFSAALEDVSLWPTPPDGDASRNYRRWALESAALDLALRQADTDLGAVLDRDSDPVRFVVSPSLSGDGGGPSIDPIRRFRERDPGIEFKLDPTPAWDDALVADLAATDAVCVLDLKGYYEGTEVDNPADPALYEHVLAAFPDAVIEDPLFTEETRSVLEPHAERLSWDYPIAGVASIRELPVEPRWLNCKPSRFGTVESLLSTIEYCEERGIRLYGGGQFELAVGRGQVQTLASLFYPDGPNDVAPGGYNDPEPAPDLPASPLAPPTDPAGFGWH